MAPIKGWPYSPGVSSSVGSSGKSSSAGVSRAVLRQLFLRRRFLRWFLRPFFLRWRFPFLRLAFFRWRFRLLRGVSQVRSLPFGAGITAGGCWRCGRRCPIPAAAPKPSLWWQNRIGPEEEGAQLPTPSPPHGARDSCRCSPRPSGMGRKSRITHPAMGRVPFSWKKGERSKLGDRRTSPNRNRNFQPGAPPDIPPPGRSPSPPGRRR